MQIPDAMRSLMAGFHQDVFLIEPTLDGATRHAASRSTHAQLVESKQFLTSLLDGSHDQAEIREVWDELPRDIRIEDDQQMIAFLKHLRDWLPRS